MKSGNLDREDGSRRATNARVRTFPLGGAATEALTRTVLRPTRPSFFPCLERRDVFGTNAARVVIEEADIAGAKRFSPEAPLLIDWRARCEGHAETGYE